MPRRHLQCRSIPNAHEQVNSVNVQYIEPTAEIHPRPNHPFLLKIPLQVLKDVSDILYTFAGKPFTDLSYYGVFTSFVDDSP